MRASRNASRSERRHPAWSASNTTEHPKSQAKYHLTNDSVYRFEFICDNSATSALRTGPTKERLASKVSMAHCKERRYLTTARDQNKCKSTQQNGLADSAVIFLPAISGHGSISLTILPQFPGIY